MFNNRKYVSDNELKIMINYNLIQCMLCFMLASALAYFPSKGKTNQKCGIQAIQPSVITPACKTLNLMKIITGCPAKPNSWPWVIQLRNNMSIDGSFIHGCGAVLISPSFALTASHCFLFTPDAKDWKAVAGRHQKDVPGRNDQIRKISKIIALPNPMRNLLDRDITLIKFNRPMNLNKYIAPICLPHREPKVGDHCVLAGWEDTRDSNDDVLKQSLMTIVDRDVCNNTKHHKGQITEYMVCSEDQYSECQDVSGNPLVCKQGSTYYVQGTGSWGNDCSRPGLPSVFGNVYKVVKWIRNQMAKNKN